MSRQKIGLRGQPVILWTANLKPNKDPLIVLTGFARVLDEFPQARLYMAYRADDLLLDVQQMLVEQPRLAASVTLLGTIPHAQIADYYNSADLFVQGSHYEGIALLDALACGVNLVVTAIPSFETITRDGEVGWLWQAGDADDFSRALRQACRSLPSHDPTRIRHFFEQHWQFAQLGRQAVAVYQRAVGDSG